MLSGYTVSTIHHTTTYQLFTCIYWQKTLQRYCSGKPAKEGWILAAPYDSKHGVGTPYVKAVDGSSPSKGSRTIKRFVMSHINSVFVYLI